MTRRVVTLVLAATITGIAVAQSEKPNLTGKWQRVATGGDTNAGTEVLTISHNDPYIYLLYRINDAEGERTLDLKGRIDGTPHEQEVEGRPATLIAQWKGQKLLLEIKREASFGYVHVGRVMTISNDGKVITVERTSYSKEGTEQGSGTERWEKK